MRDICQYLSCGRARHMMMMMMMRLDKGIWCNSHSTEMPNTRGRAQMANIAAASLQNKRLGTQTWKAARRCYARYASPAIFAVIFRATHSVAYHNEWPRGRGGGGQCQSVRPTSHAKVDVESVEQYKYSHIHNVFHSDSHTRKLSFKFSVLFVNIFELFSFLFTLSNSRSMYCSKWPLRMPANDISRHYLAPD